ncbi:MAG: T9SS type A sorting domain-containing protein, partial [Ignavibacteriae bacterium]|nr:T9SS type A sorting domain-containing protein [Ignavibacteriota bacterium]
PGDIHSVISSGPFTIPAGQMVRVAFAAIGGANLAAVQANADAAKLKWIQIKTSLGVEQGETIPTTYALEQNYPNPFNPKTNIEFQIPGDRKSGSVSLKVFDVLGREVATLVEEKKEPGTYQVSFDASRLASGVYFYKLTAGSFSQTRKMILAR